MYEAEKTRQFYDAYGELEWSRLESTAYGRLQAIIHSDFIERHVRGGDRVLDVGCGPGRFSIVMAELGATVALLDISRGQLEFARGRIGEEGRVNDVHGYIEADIAHLPMLDDAQFDVVVAYGGALSYVCEHRQQAADELRRVLRPGGTLLVSVMSCYGSAANVVRRPGLPVLKDPEAWHLRPVIATGDLPPFPSRIEGVLHPAMHIYTASELQELFASCDILELAGSNVSTYEGSKTIDEIAEDEEAWATAVEVERELCTKPGLVDTGSHMIMAAKRR